MLLPDANVWTQIYCLTPLHLRFGQEGLGGGKSDVHTDTLLQNEFKIKALMGLLYLNH